MDTNALTYQIALPLLPEVGLRTAKQLIAQMGSAEAAFRATKDDLLQHQFNAAFVNKMLAGRDAALRRAEEEVAFVEKHDIQTCFFEDADYPSALRNTPDAPLLLYAKGNMQLSDGHFLSVVGTRMPSDRGRQLCHDLVVDLAAKVPNLTIVSGLAYGIDVTAHKAAMEAGIPTVIIPAHGLDRIYPSVHRQIAVQALEQGGILTEYMSKTEPERTNFLARNRIVAGLSEATVVVESKAKGGSLVTADIAFSYGRDVFAFPGRPGDETSMGCNRLIRNNIASLITCADDLIESMMWESKPSAQTSMMSLMVDLTKDEESVLSVVRGNEDGSHINDIVTASGMTYAEVSALLFQLEMKGVVRSLPGSRYRAC